ncbi:MAG: hypothetical protein GY729_03000 [Desulfobacteraceae bacterium]|nr:hypothetical protein [Desulfobacteraceae bacterium]
MILTSLFNNYGVWFFFLGDSLIFLDTNALSTGLTLIDNHYITIILPSVPGVVKLLLFILGCISLFFIGRKLKGLGFSTFRDYLLD